MSSLKTDYKNDVFSGKRKYGVASVLNSDGSKTVTLDDLTEYTTIGSDFSLARINETNSAVNDLTASIDDYTIVMSQYWSIENKTKNFLSALKTYVKAVDVEISFSSNDTSQDLVKKNTINCGSDYTPLDFVLDVKIPSYEIWDVYLLKKSVDGNLLRTEWTSIQDLETYNWKKISYAILTVLCVYNGAI